MMAMASGVSEPSGGLLPGACVSRQVVGISATEGALRMGDALTMEV